MHKVAIVGPESTGKSTLAIKMAAQLGAHWVPEFAREYLTHLKRDYVQEDLIEIARGQLLWEKEQSELGGNWLFCDTNLLVVKVWSEVKYGSVDPWILEQIRLDKYHLHLLMYPDLPWEADPQREHPDQLLELFERYERELIVADVPYKVIKGRGEKRTMQALASLSS
ncbi:MAG: ATP-binding protein [Bacteroidota bacterium]